MKIRTFRSRTRRSNGATPTTLSVEEYSQIDSDIEYLPTLSTSIISLWGIMLKTTQLFCLRSQKRQTFGAGRARGEVSKTAKFARLGPPILGQFRGKLENLTPHISSPKGFSGAISASGDSGPRVELKFQNWPTPAAP